MDELKSMILLGVEAQLKRHGFKFIKSKERFVRLREYGTELFYIIFVHETDGYAVSPSASIRYERIETVFHKTSGVVGANYQRDTSSIGIDFWARHGNEGYRFKCANERDSLLAIKRILEIFQEEALSFFSDFSTIEKVDEVINSSPGEFCVYRPNVYLRASTGVIVSRLLGRTNHQQITDVYRAQLTDDNRGFYLPRFNALVASLEELA